MIIFVDQRIVADLLYKVLKDDPRVNKSLDVVYSHGNKSVFNKTLKKLNIESDKVMEAIRDIIDFENIQSRSLTQQRLSIENFKTGKTKVLIATSVIEEGLDIPQCNQILVFDKIRTPKTYIQMSGRARKVDSKITFLCLETEYHNTKRSIEIMQDYKELLNANKNLSTIKPKPSEYMCTYQNDEMFVIEETNARVSIDGSIDLLNKIDQKLSSGVRKTRLEEVYEEDRSKTLKFKCLLKYFIDNREVCASESPFLTEKKKSKSYSTLKLIESLYEQGYINPNLEPEIVQFSQSNILKRKREQKIQEFRDDKLKNKEAGNKEEVNIDIESEFLLAQDTEIHKQTNNTYSIIHCVPDENNEFPFPKNLKLKNIHNETLNKSIGFLSDPDHIPNSESFELFVRGEQIDRIRHFLNNTNKKFYSDASESDKSRRKQGSNSKEIINNDIKVKYNI